MKPHLPTASAGFIRSAGALLLVAGVTGFLAGGTSAVDLAPVRDPIFHCALPPLFRTAGGLAAALGCLLCFGPTPQGWQFALVSAVALTVWVARLLLAAMGIPAGFEGYLGDWASELGIRAAAAQWLLLGGGGYLLAGGLAGLWCEVKGDLASSRRKEGR